MSSAARAVWKWLSRQQRIAVAAFLIALPTTAILSQTRAFSTRAVFGKLATYFDTWPFWLLDVVLNALAIGLAAGAVWWITHRSKKSASPGNSRNVSPEEPEYRLLDDAAIETAELDELERREFVRKLSRTVVLPPNSPSVVVALEAPWGSGKTSVLSFLRQDLAKHPDHPLVVRFNPWLATGQDRIFRAFFSQFSASLLNQGEAELASELVRLGETIEELLPAGARVLPRLGLQRIQRLIGRIPVVDLEDEKDQLAASVSAVGRPIVVIIDDIDRLVPGDIRATFQLIKAVASFPRVGYVLAFDPEPVDRALRFGDTYSSGRDFRDKIVQANFQLPRLRYRTGLQYFQKRLRDRLTGWKFTLDQSEEQLLSKATPLVLTVLRTPRHMKRVLNTTLFAAEAVRGEVNFADILVFEALDMRFPKVARLIRQRPETVGAGDRKDEGEDIVKVLTSDETATGEERGANALRDLTRLYPQDREPLADLLTFLFPEKFGKPVDDEEMDRFADRRVSERENLLKLLYQGLDVEFFSAVEAQAVLTDAASRGPLISEAVESGSFPAWVNFVSGFAGSTAVPDAGELVRDLVLATNRLFARSGVDASSDIRWPVIRILGAAPSDDRYVALEHLLSGTDTAPVAEGLLTSLMRDAGLWWDGLYTGLNSLNESARREIDWADPVRLEALRVVWLDAIKRLGIRSLLLNYPNAIGAIFRLGQLRFPAYEEASMLLEEALGEPVVARAFVMKFPPGIGLEGVDKLLSADARDSIRATIESRDVPPPIRERWEEYLHSISTDERNA